MPFGFKEDLKDAMEILATEYGKTTHIVLYYDFTGSIIDNDDKLVGEFNSLEELFEMTEKLEKEQRV